MPPYPNAQRWPIAIAGTFLQICLGTVYAWSFFQKPITTRYGWSNESVTWVFSLAICFLGLAAAWGGLQLKTGRLSPRTLAVTGGALFALGHFLAAAALHTAQLWLLLLGYGVIGGTGLGLAYVVPVATAAKWFPDKKGFITGMVVMGFGLGALLMSKVLAPHALRLFDDNLALSFAAMGGVFAVLAPPAAWFMRN
ncbi:MFS transporter, partial [Geminisphaera colitermitum]|uniref:MFS transporter n=1 Tax=Geminisphaera colitermitum TaxID=1148786 RepID=UPI0005B93FBB